MARGQGGNEVVDVEHLAGNGGGGCSRHDDESGESKRKTRGSAKCGGEPGPTKLLRGSNWNEGPGVRLKTGSSRWPARNSTLCMMRANFHVTERAGVKDAARGSYSEACRVAKVVGPGVMRSQTAQTQSQHCPQRRVSASAGGGVTAASTSESRHVKAKLFVTTGASRDHRPD